ncbi:MAG TPA: TonB-dependent receptor plug domain-containing protein, partial [Gemmatirosa sp.]
VGGQDYTRLNDINFEDVENVEVLKGPAASAIYGSAAANGVILITSKHGRNGAPQYRAYLEGGPVNDANHYPVNYAALSTFAAGQPFYDIPDGGILNIRSILGSNAPYDICPNYKAATGACKQDVVLSFNQLRDSRTSPFQTGSLSTAGLNVSGGNNALTYFLSGDKARNFGVLRPNDVDRTSLRTNLTARVGANANVTVQANYVTSNTVRINNDNSLFSPILSGYFGPAQYLPGMESDTVSTPGNRLGAFFGYNNPDFRNVTVDQGVDRFIVSAQANYTPLSWLRINGNAGLDNVNTLDQQTLDPKFQIPLTQDYIRGFRQAQRSSEHVYTANASASGTFNLLHDFVSTSTLGAIYQEDALDGVYCYGVAIPSGLSSCSATATQFAVQEPFSDFKTVGGFARQEFAYADKLFISGAVRADNNSGLGGGLSYFPQTQASWVASRERFFPTIPTLSLFRLRAAYGQAGQRPGYGQALTSYSNYGALSGNQESSALLLNNIGNPSLQLERTSESELGFDANFGGDRVTIEYTYYGRRTRNELIARPLPPSSGLYTGPNAALGSSSNANIGQVFENLGAVTNKGNELGIGANLVTARNFSLSTRLTATTLSNHVVTLGNGVPPIVLGFAGAQQVRVGYPAGSFFATPITYNDANHDGKLAVSEVRVDSAQLIKGAGFAYLGPALPTNTQGLSFDMGFLRNFHVTTLFERRAGNKQLNFTEYFRCRTQNSAPYFSECGALSNPNASLASQAAYIGSQFSQFGATPAGYVQDARFIRWRELTLRFDVPQGIAQRYFRVRNGLSFSASGRNLKTWTPYTGIDPEVNTYGSQSSFAQGEFNTQPPVRTVTFRVNVQP